MASSSDEATVTSPFTGSVASSAEGELVIDENVSTVNLSPSPPAVPKMNVAVREREECDGDFLDHLSGYEGALSCQECGGEGDNNDSFVDVISGITAGGRAESQGWTFREALARANLPMETLAESGIDIAQSPTC